MVGQKFTMSKIFCLSLVLVFSFLLVGASEVDSTLEEIKKFSGEEIPGVAGKLFGNERMDIYISMNNGEEIVVGIVTENKKFVGAQKEGIENPTLRVYTDEKTLKEIQNSEDVLGSFETALNNEDIDYEAVGFGKKIKFGFLRFLSSVTGWFR